jgi:hypothetical protein
MFDVRNFTPSDEAIEEIRALIKQSGADGTSWEEIYTILEKHHKFDITPAEAITAYKRLIVEQVMSEHAFINVFAVGEE